MAKQNKTKQRQTVEEVPAQLFGRMFLAGLARTNVTLSS